MSREASLAVACFVLAVGIPGVVQAASHPPPAFYFTVIQDQVATGEPLMLQVVGPPNATFTVALNPEPFNTSQPVFSTLYQLPANPSLTNGSAIGEVSINTTLFAISAYRLTVSSVNSTIIGREVVFITVGTPTAVLAGQIEQLQLNLIENASRVQSLTYALYQQRTVDLYVLVVTGIEFVILLLFIVGTRTTAGDRRFWKRMRDTIHKIGMKGQSGVRTGHWSKDEAVAVIDPKKVWVMDLCSTCEKWHTHSELIDHAKLIHRMEPKEAERYIRVSRDAQREVLEEIKTEATRRPPHEPAPVLELDDLTFPGEGS